MPFNFLWAALIHVSFPRATIIHCRRAAIDTALSIHQTHFILAGRSRGIADSFPNCTSRPWTSRVRWLATARAMFTTSATRAPPMSASRGRSAIHRYRRLTDHWRRVLPADRVHRGRLRRPDARPNPRSGGSSRAIVGGLDCRRGSPPLQDQWRNSLLRASASGVSTDATSIEKRLRVEITSLVIATAHPHKLRAAEGGAGASTSVRPGMLLQA